MGTRIRKLRHVIEGTGTEKMLTISEVMQMFNVSRQSVWQWRFSRFKQRNRKIKPIPYKQFDHGGHVIVMFVESEVKAWAASQGILLAEARNEERERRRKLRSDRNKRLSLHSQPRGERTGRATR